MLRRILPFLLVALVAGSLPVSAGEEPLRVEARLERDSALVGQPVTLVLSLHPASGVRVDPLSLPESVEGFEILAVREPPTVRDGEAREMRVTMSAFELGDLQTPALEIGYTTSDGLSGVARAPSLPLRVESQVESLEKEGEEVALRDVKPPIRLPFEWGPVWIGLGVAAAALALAGAIAWWIRRHMRGRGEEAPAPEPLQPPDEEALSELARIEMDDLARREAAKPYYSRLSYVLRRYMGRRYGFDALETTSSELLEWASRMGWGEGLFRTLSDDLAEADSVKFARYSPSLTQRKEALERVRNLVIRTRPPKASAAVERGAA